jgi:ubiquinone/menaquinone biosynthesis C-methylase UbiE
MASGFQLAGVQAGGYQAHTAAFMGPSARLLVAGADVGAGDAVLDLACGTGLVARAALPRVTPGGRVAGADINPTMLAVARSSGASGIEWFESPAETLPFDDATFSHVLCQQGFQFFTDPTAAAGEARRVLGPGGVLAATVWATPGSNPYIETQLDLLAQLDPTLAASVQAATPPDADQLLESIATDAGFASVSLSLLEHQVEIAELGSFFLAQSATTPWASALATLSDAEQQSLADSLVQRLSACGAAGGAHVLPFCSHRLVARKV